MIFPLTAHRLLLTFFKGVDFRKIAPGAAHVHAEAEYVTIGQPDADEIGARRLRAADILVGEYRAVHLGGAGFEQLRAHGRERLPLVQYIVQHQHDTAGDRRSRGDLPRDLAAVRDIAVAGDIEIVEFQREPQLRQQLAGENHAAAHNREHERKALAELSGDLAGYAGDGLGNDGGGTQPL